MSTTDAAARRLRIVVADDHVLLRQGLKVLIEAQPDLSVVDQADGGDDAVRRTMVLQPDVVVMDVSMPDGDGVSATERIRRECPAVRVVGLSRHTDPGYARRLFDAGASGYVVKKASVSELVAAIRVAAAGGIYLDSVMTPLFKDRAFGTTHAGREADRLTAREVQVLREIARGRSNREIAGSLNLSIKTVEYHRARSSAKLQLRSRADIVKYAIVQGWLED